MIRRPPRSTLSSSSAASDVYKRQVVSTGGAMCATLGQVAIVPLIQPTSSDLRIVLLGLMGTKAVLMLGMAVEYTLGDGGSRMVAVIALISADELLRGGLDTLRSGIPVMVQGGDLERLTEFNGRFALAAQIALATGPALVSVTEQAYALRQAVWLVGVCYSVAWVGIFWMPSVPVVHGKEASAEPHPLPHPRHPGTPHFSDELVMREPRCVGGFRVCRGDPGPTREGDHRDGGLPKRLDGAPWRERGVLCVCACLLYTSPSPRDS
eukprot:TRINITY_DN21805_c0_g1_i2.p1 TRINITY_DN21805_c0_g1~~TRINITY_DN21805_c0_g1_i2.p1  ORF type:complete len:266 (-),score=50.62 TRINITY_DN21805_c0_g1_i2:153-950(-)